METEVYVGNLAESVTEQDLEELFGQVGDVVETKIIRDRITGMPRGFGFVTLGSPHEAEEAIAGFDGHEMHGRPLKVALARGRQQRRPGGGGGGGGGRFRQGGPPRGYRRREPRY